MSKKRGESMNSQQLNTHFSDYVKHCKKEIISTRKREYIAFEEYQTSYVYVVNYGIVKNELLF